MFTAHHLVQEANNKFNDVIEFDLLLCGRSKLEVVKIIVGVHPKHNPLTL